MRKRVALSAPSAPSALVNGVILQKRPSKARASKGALAPRSACGGRPAKNQQSFKSVMFGKLQFDALQCYSLDFPGQSETV